MQGKPIHQHFSGSPIAVDVVSVPVSANAVPSCEEWTAMSRTGQRMSARSSAFGDGIGNLRESVLPLLLPGMSREG